MQFVVTGGAGFIGSHMVDVLLARGHSVTVYDNFSSGQRAHLAHHGPEAMLAITEGDLSDLERFTGVLPGHDAVIHFASNPDIARGMTETDLDLRQGTILTYNVLEAMRRTGIRHLLYASGSGVYGDVGTTPTAEDFGPLLPISLYGASKLACEGLISAFCGQFDLQAWMFRFANVVGGRQTHGVGYDFIRRLREERKRLTILGDGTQSKSYIHVSDVICAMLHVSENATERVNIFNVATEDYIDVTSIARIVIEEMGLEAVELEYTGGDRGWKGDVPKVRFVLDKIHALGWSARMSTREAVTKSVREMLGKE
jgi:UDP-glucose 4-epimerase